MSATPRRNTAGGRGGAPLKRSNSNAGGSQPAASATESIDAHLIEPVPPGLKKFHPGKGAILVRKVEVMPNSSSKATSAHEALANAVLGSSAALATPTSSGPSSSHDRVLALGPKGLYISDPNGTVLRVMVYEDIKSLTLFQKYVHIVFTTREDNDAHELLMCMSPFPENSRNNPRDVSDAIMRKVGKDVSVDQPTAEDLGLGPASNKSFCPSVPASPGSPYNGKLGESFAGSPMLSLTTDKSFASASNASMVLLSPFEDYGPGEWGRVVHALYEHAMPSKLAEVPELLKKFAGVEQNLVLGIVKKYSIARPEDIIAAACGRSVTGTSTVAAHLVAHPVATSAPTHVGQETSAPLISRPASPTVPQQHHAPGAPTSQSRPSPHSPIAEEVITDEARKFQRALEAASNATDDFAVHSQRDVGGDMGEHSNAHDAEYYGRTNTIDDEEPVYYEWNASQWADRLEARVVDASSPVPLVAPSSRPLHPEDDYDVNPDPTHEYDPVVAANDARYSPLALEDQRELLTTVVDDDVDQNGGGYSPMFDPSIQTSLTAAPVVIDPSLRYAHQLLADENPAVEQYTARRIHLPSIERRERHDAYEGAFDTFDHSPPSAHMVQDRTPAFHLYEARDRSQTPELLNFRSLQELSTPVRHVGHALTTRRVFGGGSGLPATRSAGLIEDSLSRGGDTPELHFRGSLPHRVVDGDEPIEAESFPAWETAEHTSATAASGFARVQQGASSRAAQRQPSFEESPVQHSKRSPSLPQTATATSSNYISRSVSHSAVDVTAGTDRSHPLSSTFTLPARLPATKRDSIMGASRTTSDHHRAAHASPASSSVTQTERRIDGLDWDESVPIASPGLPKHSIGRYFLSANATEAMKLLRPEHAITVPHHDASTIDVEELIALAVGILKESRGGAAVSATAARLYQSWSVDIQSNCFVALQALLNDEWRCSAFLNALAPLVDFRFDSIIIAMKGDAAVASADLVDSDGHHRHHGRRRVQMNCPQVLFDAFVAAWDLRCRHVLRVTSRHGCFTLSDVSVQFLEYIDRYSSYSGGRTSDAMAGGAHKDAQLQQQRASLLNNTVTAPLAPASRRSAMERDVGRYEAGGFPSTMFPKDRLAPASDFSSLWARGNVLLRVHSLPFHGSAAASLKAAFNDVDSAYNAAEVDYGGVGPSGSIAGGMTSLPLTEWNDLVSRWNTLPA